MKTGAGVYLAGRTRSIDKISSLAELLGKNGYEITFRWFNDAGVVRKNYRAESLSDEYDYLIKNSLKGAAVADVFILLSEPNMRGTYVEMGAFLNAAYYGNKPNPRMYIVGGKDDSHVFESNEFTSFVTEDQLRNIISLKKL